MRLILICATAAGLAAMATAACAFDWPARKPGQWDIQMSTSQGETGLPPMSIKMCLDAATDKEMMEAGTALGKSMCPDQTVVKDGETIVISSTCEMAGMKVASRTEIAGDFQSNYTLKVTGEVTGAPAGMSGATNMEQKARWTSDTCSDGMQPGDMLMPGGIKVNVKQMSDMMKSLGGQ